MAIPESQNKKPFRKFQKTVCRNFPHLKSLNTVLGKANPPGILAKKRSLSGTNRAATQTTNGGKPRNQKKQRNRTRSPDSELNLKVEKRTLNAELHLDKNWENP